MVVGIIGTGLIGGSMAIDLKKNRFADKIIGVEQNSLNAEVAKNLGIIDEVADLMSLARKEVATDVQRIAQKARAVGIHMIIATQRPTTNIITGTIKANFPARMAFRVISQIDSRTILERTGANQLQGRGDMLFLAGNDPVRVQCALIETKEVERVCAHIAKQQGYASAYILPEPDESTGDGGSSSSSSRMLKKPTDWNRRSSDRA